MGEETRLEELLSLWDRGRAEGRAVAAQELCIGHPELLVPLQRRIEEVLRLEQLEQGVPRATLDSTVNANAASSGAPAAGIPTSPPVGESGSLTTPANEFDARGYELIETLGAGGMGEVYRSCDPSLGRDLAIKVIQAHYRNHPAVERRFLREARITGSLQHPNIVAVHNLGRLPDGRLHYTMRLVRGRTFADILKEEAGKLVRLPYLLSIFEKICQAVAYAHSKRVLHRDLKPANVMVGRFGEVQVMDWGLAKLLTVEEPAAEAEAAEKEGTRIPTESADTPLDLTQLGREMGTPAYMSPEQALGEWDNVDERTDVFALGAILCEILTVRPPYTGRDSLEMLRKAKRGDLAEALARLESCGADEALVQLCRDCLTPALEGRLRNAEQVAQRVAAYQAEVQERLRRAELERAAEAVKVREERKRRRLLFASMLVLSTAALVSGWLAVRATNAAEAERQAKLDAETAADAERVARGAEVEQRKQAEEQKRRAEDNARKAEKSEADAKAVLRFFQNKVLSAGRPKDQEGGLGKDVTLRQAVDKAAKDIADSFKDRPLVEAVIRNTLGMTYSYLGEPALAIEQFAQALTLRFDKLGPDHQETLESRSNLAITYMSAGRTADAIDLLEQILKQSEAKLGANHRDTLAIRNNLAMALENGGRTKEAIRLLEQTLQQREAKLGADHPDTLTSRNNLANAYGDAGRTAEAIRLHEQTLKQSEAKLGPDHPNTLGSRISLAMAYLDAGRTADAIRLCEQTLPLMEAKLGPDHPSTLNCRNNLASAYNIAGRTADAIRLHEQNLKQYEAKLGPDHPLSFKSRNNLATAYRTAGRTADAIRLYEQSLKQSEAKLGSDHLQTLRSMANLGVSYRVAGRFKEAIARLEEALERGHKLPGGLPFKLAWIPGALAQTYDQAGQFTKAESIYRDFLDQTQRKFGADDPRTAGTLALVGANLLKQKKYADAEPLLRQCLALRAKEQPDEWTTFNTRSALGEALLGQKKYAEAEPLLVQGYEGMNQRQDKIPPQGRIRLSEALERLVRLYEATEQKEKAADWRKKLHEAKAAQKPPKP